LEEVSVFPCILLATSSLFNPGYSWFTNQYGLTIDTAIAFELVKPSGEIVTVTNDSDTDLFFSLKVRSLLTF
jgi:hypothetical protein